MKSSENYLYKQTRIYVLTFKSLYDCNAKKESAH